MTNYIKLYERTFGITWDHKKYEIHHIDGNRDNNNIQNLVLLPKELHRDLHSVQIQIDALETAEYDFLNFGQSSWMMFDPESYLEVLDRCRKWGALKSLNYRRWNGGAMTMEEIEIWHL